MNKNIILIFPIFFSLLNCKVTKEVDKNCPNCNRTTVELKAEIKELESSNRKYRDEVAKWMKMYYEARDTSYSMCEKWMGEAAKYAEKVCTISTKFCKY
jgi:hypothetical protein